jgi:hypothetical protein
VAVSSPRPLIAKDSRHHAPVKRNGMLLAAHLLNSGVQIRNVLLQQVVLMAESNNRIAQNVDVMSHCVDGNNVIAESGNAIAQCDCLKERFACPTRLKEPFAWQASGSS